MDYRTAFERGETTWDGPNHLGPFLHWLLWKRRELNVYLLKSNRRLLPAFDGCWFGVAPVSLLNQFTSSSVHFAVDGVHPTGAVHHQKIVVVDDAVAFCDGIDLTIGRWDTRAHLSVDPHHHDATPLSSPARRHGWKFHWPQSWASTSLTSTSIPPTTGPGFDAVATMRW